MRTIGVVTTSRADFGIYRPVLQAIENHPELELYLFVTGMHLSPEFGGTIDEIREEGFEIDARVEMLMSSDSPGGISRSMGIGMIGFAQAFETERPDLLLVLGDRYEMFAAASSAIPFKMPIAHIHGGESTEGLIDEAIRHSITKMSHLHFVTTEEYHRRVVQMGESPQRVMVSGAPSLDNLRKLELLERSELETRLDLDLSTAPVLVTFHPVTLEFENTREHIDTLLAALGEVERPIVITYPNADTAGRVIIDAVETFAEQRSNVIFVTNLGSRVYFSLMRTSAVMVGNSSSGIIEAASFDLPVVNLGKRQAGRISGKNVLGCPVELDSIREALQKALSTDFQESLKGMKNPYGDGQAAERIVEELAGRDLSNELLLKEFHDLPAPNRA